MWGSFSHVDTSVSNYTGPQEKEAKQQRTTSRTSQPAATLFLMGHVAAATEVAAAHITPIVAVAAASFVVILATHICRL